MVASSRASSVRRSAGKPRFGARATSARPPDPTRRTRPGRDLAAPTRDRRPTQPRDLRHALDAAPAEVRRPQAREASAVALVQEGHDVVDAGVQPRGRAPRVRAAGAAAAVMDRSETRARHETTCTMNDTMQRAAPAGEGDLRNLAKLFSAKPLR